MTPPPISFLTMTGADLRARGISVTHIARLARIDSRRLGFALNGSGLGYLTVDELDRLLRVAVEQGLLRR
jgi:hypothetical protein